MARKAQPPSAAFRKLSQQVEPGDEIVATFWGLTGWSMNVWIVINQVFAILLVLPFMLSLRKLYYPDIALCGTVGALLTVSFLTRPALAIVVTRRQQMLCCRTSRPSQRMAVSQAPAGTARLADVRRGLFFSRLRYMGPGTDGEMVHLNVPSACLQAVQATTEMLTSGTLPADA